MSNAAASAFTIRRAEVSERDQVRRVTNSAFSGEGGRRVDFLRSHPYLFCDERVPNHFVRVENGEIVGVVGLYPYEMRVGGVSFRTAGLGQVLPTPRNAARSALRMYFSSFGSGTFSPLGVS